MKQGLSKRIISPGSESAWREWRRAGLGASDIVVIRGLSPHKTRSQLLLEKVEGIDQPLNKYLADNAADQEFRARYRLNKVKKCKLEPICIENFLNPRLRASLDGYCMETKTLMEHKCVGKKLFEFISKHEVLNEDTKLGNPFAGHVEQIIWQAGLLSTHYVESMFLSYSTLKGNESHLMLINLPWYSIRRIFKCQQAAAKDFLREWDEINEHKRKNKGANEC